ncbi:WapI family immunity protein [Micromonospora zamorensis]|uniref:WapI family immunity protein n=1 Tax=Micromonospora zamorensis TaxID=709883 RepID=UPI003CF3B29F
MEIRSDDGARVRIRPVGYQPGIDPPDDPDGPTPGWHDWLLIEVDARTADGQTWSHHYPSLMVEEARALGGWLHGQATAALGLSAPPALVRFTEPNLALRSRVLRRRRLELIVEFSAESLPPWMRRPSTAIYPLVLTVSADALATAAEHWAEHCEAYPPRTRSRFPTRGRLPDPLG